MSIKTRILAAVDGSSQSLAAVGYLSRVLKAGKFEILLFHVGSGIPDPLWDITHDPSSLKEVVMFGEWIGHQKNALFDFMESAHRLFKEAGFPEKDVSIQMQDLKKGVARDILDKAREGFEAVVVGQTGHSIMKELFMGGIANKLLSAMSNVTLCLVAGEPVGRNFLAALDPSEGSARVISRLASLSAGGDREVTLFHAVRRLEIRTSIPELIEAAKIAEMNLLEEDRRIMSPAMNAARNALIEAGIEEKKITTLIASGISSRSEAIVKAARDQGCPSIFIGRRGLSEPNDFSLGGVAAKTVYLAKDAAVWVVSQ
ncbi:MAG: universal stress protein [Deltaproteobacteria bacterium]|nr:universal stress protein [Deltaproteobacteria bacterium]